MTFPDLPRPRSVRQAAILTSRISAPPPRKTDSPILRRDPIHERRKHEASPPVETISMGADKYVRPCARDRYCVQCLLQRCPGTGEQADRSPEVPGREGSAG